MQSFVKQSWLKSSITLSRFFKAFLFWISPKWTNKKKNLEFSVSWNLPKFCSCSEKWALNRYWQKCKTCQTACTDGKMHSVEFLPIIALCISSVVPWPFSFFMTPHARQLVGGVLMWQPAAPCTQVKRWTRNQSFEQQLGQRFSGKDLCWKDPCRRYIIWLPCVF